MTSVSSKHLLIAILFATMAVASRGVLAEEPVNYLKQIKPILAGRCYACHGALKQEGGLRLDTAKLAIQGGDSGPAVKPGDPARSLLVQRVSATDETERMPEEGEPLKAEQIVLVKSWIAQNATAPVDESPAPDPRTHWAYQPVKRPEVPTVRDPAWSGNPIDAFLASGYESAGVTPQDAADKPTLLRRVYFDLIGLPPTREQIYAFVGDESPAAYEHVVEKLLANPQYGERWARHWMDVWRYSDWSGYRDEVRNSARHIWHWRDWIVESLNADKGYDRMVVEMLAGDEVAPDDPDTVRATGYLTRDWILFDRNGWLNNLIEHSSKAFLGVTMNCCRCHDHKYDPISQADYYRMRAIFEPYYVRTDRVPGEPDILKNGLPRAYDAKPDDVTYVSKRGDPTQPDTKQKMWPGVPNVLGGSLAIEPVKLSLTAFYPGLRDGTVAEDEAAAAKLVADREGARVAAQKVVAVTQKKLSKLTAKKADLSAAQSELAAAVEKAEIADRQLTTARAGQASLLARVAAERAKYGSAADVAALALIAGKAECNFKLCTAQEQQATGEQELASAQAAKKEGNAAIQAAVKTAEDKVTAAKTAVATAHAALATPTSTYKPLSEVGSATSTGRRTALARWIVSRDNPLAARVAVNHIWLRHFGAPLVANMFDFGLRTPAPRNQPLLDWLAVELIEHQWSMRHIHQLIVTSRAYRMKSSGGERAAANVAIDPDNQLLWRMNPRRLEAEAIRDATLFVAGKLDLTQGGPDIDQQLALQSPRRSLYFRHAYEKQAKFMELFDGASVNECYRRSESVMPQQALALENSELGLEDSRRLAAQLSMESASGPTPDEAFVKEAFTQTLGREPSSAEDDECLAFLKSQAEQLRDKENLTASKGGGKVAVEASADPAQRAREDLVHVLINHNDFVTIR
jgi:hypothetical protein